MATEKIIIEGKEEDVEILNYTSKTYAASLAAIGTYTKYFSNFSTEEKVLVKWAGKVAGTSVGALVTFVQDENGWRAFSKVSGSFIAGFAAPTITEAIVAFAAGLGATLSAPVIIGVGITAGVAMSIAGRDSGEAIYYSLLDWFGYGVAQDKNTKIEVDKNGNTTISTTNTLKTFLDNDSSLLTSLGNSPSDNWDIRATIPSVSNPESFTEQLKYDSTSETATLKTDNINTQLEGTTLLLKTTQAKTLTLNNQTLDIATPTALQLRNALESISDYQFLLSDVLIKPDELLDMGEAGVITVSSGDTLSQLAVKYLGGSAVDATREAVLLNPWLADLGRISFIADTNKILLESGASLSDTNVDHTYKNEESADFFYDANGGFDTYLTGDGDTIQDSDGKGLIKFKDIDLTGTKVLNDGSTDVYVDQEDKSSTTPVFEYKKEDNNLVVTHLSSGESITILEWSKEKNLGITLQKSEDIDINVGDASEIEAAQEMQVSVEILRELDVGEVVDVEVGYYIPTYKVEYGAEVFVAAQEAYTYRPERQITTGEEFVGVGSITFTKEDEQTQELKNSKKGNKIA